MDLATADCVIAGITLVGAILGLFVGFSGGLSFLAGVMAAVLVAKSGWALSDSLLAAEWQRSIAVLVASLLAFGIVRWLVKKFVHGLVAQPGDAILGSLSMGATAFMLVIGAVWAVNMVVGGEPVVESAIVEKVVSCAGVFR